MALDFNDMDTSWTLFLDRDGVINKEKSGDYIYNWDSFVFYEDALPALKEFAKWFGKIFIITNQRGVGKGLMSEADLQDIHTHLLEAVEATGGRIDGIYYCTDAEDGGRRKPKPGMALEAKRDFPEIDFTKSLMLGNRLSDMEFGRNLGMKTIYLQTTHPEITAEHSWVDAAFPHLPAVVNAFRFARLSSG